MLRKNTIFVVVGVLFLVAIFIQFFFFYLPEQSQETNRSEQYLSQLYDRFGFVLDRSNKYPVLIYDHKQVPLPSVSVTLKGEDIPKQSGKNVFSWLDEKTIAYETRSLRKGHYLSVNLITHQKKEITNIQKLDVFNSKSMDFKGKNNNLSRVLSEKDSHGWSTPIFRSSL